jgi:hypothetical protein
LSREELLGEELFVVSVSHSASYISDLEHKAAHKLGRFVDVQYLSFLLISISQLTKKDLSQILNNFSLEKLFSLARLDLGLFAAEDHHLCCQESSEDFNIDFSPKPYLRYL